MRSKEKLNEWARKHGRTKKGLISRIYHGQTRRSRKRNHPMPTYTKNDLQDWLLSQKKFHHLFHLWEVSNYDKMLVPSVDRIDSATPYNFSNIQLVTWGDNNKNGNNDIRCGKTIHGNKPHKTVLQYTKDGQFMEEYISTKDASRKANVWQQNISKVCNGELRTAGGFIWRFKDET